MGCALNHGGGPVIKARPVLSYDRLIAEGLQFNSSQSAGLAGMGVLPGFLCTVH